jgi:O-acetyl-ADP-ribose deacetylase (regulator of RNase III)
VIVISHGNLLTADAEALVNTVNTVGVMGKGIALQFKRAYPDNYQAYRTACATRQVRLGEMFVFDSGRLGPRRYIINFPTKDHWRSRSRIADIRAGLADLVRVVNERQISSIAIPALGCGNGGLRWEEVHPEIERATKELNGVRVLLFPPEGAPDPTEMPIATEAPPLTLGRATLLKAMAQYLDRAQCLEPRVGITLLEIQKIAYFLQLMGEPFNLKFVRGRYGPYAERLNQVLDLLEGHFIVGYGDRTIPVTDLHPITLTPGSIDAVNRWFDSSGNRPPASLGRLARLVSGFETPYSLELLATVHFAAGMEATTDDLAELIERIRAWSGRKARLFTSHHITMAYERLRSVGLLPIAASTAGGSVESAGSDGTGRY